MYVIILLNKPEREYKNLKTRVKSAIVLLSVTLLCVLLSPVTRILFFAVVGGVCAYEYSKNVEKLDASCTLWVMILYLAVQAVLAYLHAGYLSYTICFIVCVYLSLFSGVLHKKVSGRGALYTLAGLSYPCLPFGLILVISVSDIWWQTIVLACASTWICDSFALFGGMKFGKHKLAPHVSPKKTWEGCISGALSSVVTGVLIFFIYKGVYPIPLWLCVFTALLASTVGQLGDLAESMLKRMIGVKDFSNLIPGHGGALDRMDSLMFSVPATYICLLLAGV